MAGRLFVGGFRRRRSAVLHLGVTCRRLWPTAWCCNTPAHLQHARLLAWPGGLLESTRLLPGPGLITWRPYLHIRCEFVCLCTHSGVQYLGVDSGRRNNLYTAVIFFVNSTRRSHLFLCFFSACVLLTLKFLEPTRRSRSEVGLNVVHNCCPTLACRPCAAAERSPHCSTHVAYTELRVVSEQYA